MNSATIAKARQIGPVGKAASRRTPPRAPRGVVDDADVCRGPGGSVELPRRGAPVGREHANEHDVLGRVRLQTEAGGVRADGAVEGHEDLRAELGVAREARGGYRVDPRRVSQVQGGGRRDRRGERGGIPWPFAGLCQMVRRGRRPLSLRLRLGASCGVPSSVRGLSPGGRAVRWTVLPPSIFAFRRSNGRWRRERERVTKGRTSTRWGGTCSSC